jgi:hypothetical protein
MKDFNKRLVLVIKEMKTNHWSREDVPRAYLGKPLYRGPRLIAIMVFSNVRGDICQDISGPRHERMLSEKQEIL